jgi:hypothetical protein
VGKELGYGDLRIFTQSGEAGADTFDSITLPAAFRTAMMGGRVEAQVAARRRAAPAQEPAAHAAPVAPIAAPMAPAAPAAPIRPAAPVGLAASPMDDDAARLIRLAELRDRGILSVAEFEAKKAEILARM